MHVRLGVPSASAVDTRTREALAARCTVSIAIPPVSARPPSEARAAARGDIREKFRRVRVRERAQGAPTAHAEGCPPLMPSHAQGRREGGPAGWRATPRLAREWQARARPVLGLPFVCAA